MKRMRLEEIEILRGLAFLAVVFQHTMAGLFYQPDIGLRSIAFGTTLLGLTRFAVPLFVFISGVVLFYNYNSQLNYKNFLIKRFVQIVIPYVCWTVFYYVWVSFLSGMPASTTRGELSKLFHLSLTGTASYHLWFIIMIIPFYFLFPLFRAFLSKERTLSSNLMTLAAVFVGNIALVYVLSKGWIRTDNPHFSFIITYLDRNFIFWIFYFVLGGFAGLYYDQWKAFVRKAFIPSLVLLAGCMYKIYSDIAIVNLSVSGENYLWSANVTGPLKPFMMITITLLIILVFALAERLTLRPSVLTSMLHTFGKYSFGAYLIHAFVLRSTNEFVISYFGTYHIFSQLIASFILCSLLSLLACWFISQIKLSFGEAVVGKV